ncbi:MAG TPA: glycosyltransferase family 1 protein [Acidobacteriaceae bacterium]|nr:glycosyltransferase family 1 protein [Acidobacteriaceae bacterium]
MKILVAAISFSSKISGIQRHAFNLVRCLLANPEISAVHLVIAPWQQEMTKSAGLAPDSRLEIHVPHLKPDSISRNLWHYRDLPELARHLRSDLIHLTYPVPIDASSLACPVVLTLHDLYPYEIPSNFRFPRVIVNRLTLRHCLRNVNAIACVSDVTLLRLKQFAPTRVERKAVRIYNCVEAAASDGPKTPLPEICSKPFLLSVAQHRRNKNIPLMIRVFAFLLSRGEIHSSTNLLIVGIPGPETASIQKMIAQRSLNKRVFLYDGLSDSELRWCYELCDALLVPSTTEGFGLPVAEGLLVGCRVVCSNIPALREVGGKRCHYFELGEDEEQSFAGAITTSLKQPKPPAINLPHLSAETLASEYVALYRQVIENRFAQIASQPNHSKLRDGSALREV